VNMTDVNLVDFLERLRSYDPDIDKGKVLRFAEIAKAFPHVPLSVARRYPRVGMADFAEIGYCAYKGWHRGRGTEVRRPARTAERVTRGEKIHARKVDEELQVARKLPVATPADLRNPMVDMASIPELPALIKVGGLVYMSSVERAGRNKGDLIIVEIKTGNWVRMPDHYLQTWGYCLSAPSALLRVTDNNFRARGVRWSLSYPESDFGPHGFTEKTLSLVREGMQLFGRLYRLGAAADARVPNDPYGPSRRKCPPCGFAHDCSWRYADEGTATHLAAGGPNAPAVLRAGEDGAP